MLIQPDGLLSPQESVLREREDLLRIASRKKINSQAELEDAERSAGPRLAYTEVIRRIRKANSRIKVVDGSANQVAIYRPRRADEYDQEETTVYKSGHEWHRDYKYISGMEKHDMPEFAHVILDSSELPIKEYRGWRTVLIACIKSGALTYAQAVQHFGEPAGARAWRWNDALKDFKPR